MVGTAGDTPSWADELDRPEYLRFLAALQRWLAEHGPGMVRGDELRLVNPRRALALAPLVAATRGATDVYAALAAALEAARADADRDGPAATVVTAEPETTEPETTEPGTTEPETRRPDAVDHGDTEADGPASDRSYPHVLERLALRLTAPDRVTDELAVDVGVPGIRAVLVELAADGPRDVTMLEASTWPVSHDELVDHAARRLAGTQPESVRSVELPGIGAVLALEGERVTTAAHALWVERYAGHSPRGWVVGIPDDHLVFVRSLVEPTSPHQIGALAALVADEHARGLGPVSPSLLWFGPDRVVELHADPVTGTVEIPEVSTAH